MSLQFVQEWQLRWEQFYLCAGEKGKRSGLTHSRIMIHQPMGGAQGQASDIEITAREIITLKEELYKIISKHSGQDYEKVYEDSDRDYWMKAEKALEYGMIDEILAKISPDSYRDWIFEILNIGI